MSKTTMCMPLLAKPLADAMGWYFLCTNPIQRPPLSLVPVHEYEGTESLWEHIESAAFHQLIPWRKWGSSGTRTTLPTLTTWRPQTSNFRLLALCLIEQKINAPPGLEKHQRGYLITSSASLRSDGGSVMPRASAVLRFRKSSSLWGSSMGRSVGVCPAAAPW
jgi:hypothetical protein